MSAGTQDQGPEVVRVTLGQDPIPASVRRNIAHAVAILEAKLALIEDGVLSADQLNLYDWIVEENTPNPGLADGGELVVVWKRIVGQ